jgi:hypothetical protein
MAMDVALPAHLQSNAVANSLADSLMVTGPSFPKLSIKQGRFRLCKDGEEKLIKLDEFKVVIVLATPLSNKPAKVFYKDSYSSGDVDAPDCMSSDGIRPDTSVENPYSTTTCAACPMNAWGSAKTNDGRDAKACKDTKVLYLAVPIGESVSNEIVQLRVPTMSLKNLSKYAEQLSSRRFPVDAVITKLSFDESKEYPELLFNFGGFLSEPQYQKVRDLAAGDTITQILNGHVSIKEPATSGKKTTEVVPVDDAPEELAPPVKHSTPKIKSLFEDYLGEEAYEDEETEDLDVDGRPWDVRIDSANKKKSKTSGKWMRRNNIDDEYYLQVKAQLLGKETPAEPVASEPVASEPIESGDDFDAELDSILADFD